MSLLTLGITGNTDRAGFAYDSGIVAAFSLSKIKTGATNCIDVRRASDNTVQTIGFAGGDLDTSALLSFCAGTDGFVSKWYSQDGSGNYASQSTSSRQPKIVSSGTLETVNGKAAMLFDGVNDKLDIFSPISAEIGMSVFVIGKRLSSLTYGPIISTDNNSTYSPALFLPSSNNYYFYVVDQGYAASSSAYTTTAQEINSFLYPSSFTTTLHVNGTLISFGSMNSLSNTTDFKEIGSRTANGEYTNGYIQEVLFYSTDQTSNRAAIETNRRNYFGF